MSKALLNPLFEEFAAFPSEFFSSSTYVKLHNLQRNISCYIELRDQKWKNPYLLASLKFTYLEVQMHFRCSLGTKIHHFLLFMRKKSSLLSYDHQLSNKTNDYPTMTWIRGFDLRHFKRRYPLFISFMSSEYFAEFPRPLNHRTCLSAESEHKSQESLKK